MSVITSVLIGAAAKVGAPLVKSILEKHIGGAAGELGGVIVDAIAEKVGVPVEDLGTVSAPKLEQAVAAVEAETPELVAAWTAAQSEANRLMLAEMQASKETPFGWLWRPAGMWLMLLCIAWYVMLVPLLNAILAAAGAREGIAQSVEFSSFVTVFVTYIGLYMGGHTAIRVTKGAR